MKILIIGSGGREHALAWKIAQSKKVTHIFIAPGNAGSASIGTNIPVDSNDIDGLLDFAIQNSIDLTIIGPEAPLALGIVDVFESVDLLVFGPSKKAAQLETSKVFSKRFLKKFKIPTAGFAVFSSFQKAKKYLKTSNFPTVVKADGLAEGKGVFVCSDYKEALMALKTIMIKKQFGEAGDRVIVEECLFGQEASVICFTDGKNVLPLLPAQDHKPIFDGDCGPNTGGMGAYAPTPLITKEIMQEISQTILKPTIQGMASLATPYKGILYAGLMMTKQGPKVLEFNCRFGDPETQPQLMLLKSDLVTLMQRCLAGKLKGAKLSWHPGFSVCVVMASGGYPTKYTKGFPIRNLPEKENPDIHVFHAGTIKKSNAIVTNGGRVLGVTSRAPTLKLAISKAYRLVNKIDFKNKFFRSDIGAKTLDK